MRFPSEIWDDPADAGLALGAVEVLSGEALIVTDRLTNAVFINEAAESILGDRAESLVNRTTLSLLGYAKPEGLPQGLVNALLAQTGPWRGVANLDAAGGAVPCVVEASAVRRGDRLVCGVLRIAPRQGKA